MAFGLVELAGEKVPGGVLLLTAFADPECPDFVYNGTPLVGRRDQGFRVILKFCQRWPPGVELTAGNLQLA